MSSSDVQVYALSLIGQATAEETLSVLWWGLPEPQIYGAACSCRAHFGFQGATVWVFVTWLLGLCLAHTCAKVAVPMHM